MWKRRARSGALVGLAGVSLYFLLPSLVGVFASWRSLSHLDWSFALLALACEAASYMCLWDLDRIALKTGAWLPVAAAQLTGTAAGRILPGGGATATAFSTSMLRKTGVDAGEAAAAFTASALLQIATKLALPILALPAIVGGAPVDHGLAVAAYLGLGVLVLLVAAGAAAFATDAPLVLAGRATQWILNATVRRRRHVSGLSQELIADRDFIRTTLGERRRPALLAAVANTGFDYLALLFALRAVGADARPSLVVLAYTAGALLALVPFTPGGLGFVEAGLVGALTLAGVSARDALAATLLYRLVSFWLPIPAGGVAYVLFRSRDRSLRASRTRSAASPIPAGASSHESAVVKRTTRRSQMESTFDRATTMVNTQLTKVRWALGLNGVLAIAVGVVILVWPGISLYALTILFGAYSLATGVIGLGAALSGAPKGQRGWLVVSSLLGIAVGVMVFVWTGISALALLYVIGAYAVALGIIAIAGAFYLPLDGGDTALMVVSGIVSILFGIVIFAKPGAGALVVLALIAAFALVTGITEVIVAIGAKRMLRNDMKRPFAPRPSPSST
jgi:uncharacterized protein (TIRG00374 family)